jgi:hypothetical protein
MEAIFFNPEKSWYKMYDNLHKNHLPNETHCSLIGHKRMNLLVRHSCACRLEGKNQSERRTEDTAHRKKLEALVIFSR